MNFKIFKIYFLTLVILYSNARGFHNLNNPELKISDYLKELKRLLTTILETTKVSRCFAIITDAYHLSLFSEEFFKSGTTLKCTFLVSISNAEDLLSTNYNTLKILKNVKSSNCDLVFLLILNGIKVGRFLEFVDKNRILNMSAKFVLLYDHRIFDTSLHYIWRKLIRVVFIKELWQKTTFSGFELLTVPFPNILRNIFAGKKLAIWRVGSNKTVKDIFVDKTKNLQGIKLRAVVQEHVPMIIQKEDNSYAGLEVEILQSLSKIMNFEVNFYQSSDSATERWGRHLSNGSYTGLIGEMVYRRADIAVGDLAYNTFLLQLMDFTISHSSECFTFLTPESTADNSWKTLILPFSGSMWAAILISFFFVGAIFYIISLIHFSIISKNHAVGYGTRSLELRKKSAVPNSIKKSLKVAQIKHLPKERRTPLKDIFNEFSSCLLLTYSMLLFVSLPRMPRDWSLRVLTGWYWIYCILVVATYRASFTAILANPSPKITIDTLHELAESNIIVGALGDRTKQFFQGAFDADSQKIASKLEEVNDICKTTERIMNGQYAYYDNEFFLRYLRSQVNYDRNEEVLHIMKECVVNMPISIGLEKNSPLKSNMDKYIRRLIEGGFIAKWLKDSTSDLTAEEQSPPEALINLKKFWSSFVALGLGYLIGFISLIGELIHFKYVVQKHPLYDPHNMRSYYDST